MSRGSTLADFKLEDRVGKGSFGSVYKAIRKSDGRTYAVKKVNIKTMPQAEREDALNEIRVLASLQEPPEHAH
jgi:NIMA (never in mitosis gene a)-related kinase